MNPTQDAMISATDNENYFILKESSDFSIKTDQGTVTKE